MADEEIHPGLARILREREGAARALTLLGEELSGADLATLLLEVVRRRVSAIAPTGVLAQYERDRFVAPASTDPLRIRALELDALRSLQPTFEAVTTSPLAPLGTHSVVAGVHQHRVVSTIRGTEVAADPTSSLALEAAVRRRRLLAVDPHAPDDVHLAAADRIVRAQRFDGPRSFAHFALLGLVSAGRDTGGHEFERRALLLHLRALAAICRRAGFATVRVQLTDFDGAFADDLRTIADALRDDATSVEVWPQREAGRVYYPNVCCKVGVQHDGEEIEVADGGVVDWSQRLLGNRKERMVISGVGLERLAMVVDPR